MAYIRDIVLAFGALFALATVASVVGCASVTEENAQSVREPAAIVALGDFNPDGEPGGERIARQFRRSLAHYLERSAAFDQVLTTVPARLPQDSIVITGRFIDIDPGSEALRLLVGFGAGSPALVARFKICDGELRPLVTFKERTHNLSGGGYSAHHSPVYVDDLVDRFAEDAASAIVRWEHGENVGGGFALSL